VLVAVISDIHSNAYALQAVLEDVKSADVNEVWVSGDTFGYYPWAAESFRLLTEKPQRAVLGNHDSWVSGRRPIPPGIVGQIARHNALDLAARAPEALDWLQKLAPTMQFEREGWQITMAHGTPDDPLDGRYYPDDQDARDWLPGPGEILVLGQTHYPMARGSGREGLFVNPGSVGQPRDSNPMPSWALLDLAVGCAVIRRTDYNHRAVIATLHDLGWDDQVTSALAKGARSGSRS
jgi:predicted phosphodiesterase